MNINKYCLTLRCSRLCSELPKETLLETLKNRMIKVLVNVLRGAILQWQRNGLEDKTSNFQQLQGMEFHPQQPFRKLQRGKVISYVHKIHVWEPETPVFSISMHTVV